MRIQIHDFAGHPFQLELSHALADRGHEVEHVYCSSVLTPQASFARPGAARVRSISLNRTFEKYRPLRRVLDEADYGSRAAFGLRKFRPEVVVFSNMPVISALVQTVVSRAFRTPSIIWLQDVQSGLARVAGSASAGKSVETLERAMIRSSSAVIAISDELADVVSRWSARTPVDVIPNWATIGELPSLPKDNEWAVSHGLHDRICFLYSGTLGKKHSPEVLLTIADELVHADRRAALVVVGQGAGMDWLRDQLVAAPRDNVRLFPFQPYTILPQVMASADALITLLDPSAGAFAVPSKTLSYLCAARPVLACVPPSNAVSRLITSDAGAGIAVTPGDETGLRAAVRILVDDASKRATLGANARAYAERTFDIRTIAERFESVLDRHAKEKK